MIKKLRGLHIMDHGEQFLTCWLTLATKDTTFAGIHHQELQDEVQAVKTARERVRDLENTLRGLRFERDQADRKLAEKLIRVASGVRSEPGYGEDCGLYSALGFVPLSKNRSGRPRKPKTENAKRRKNQTTKDKKLLP